MIGNELGNALIDCTGADSLNSYDRGRVNKAQCLDMREEGKTMTKNIFCLNFWKMLVPLTSMGNPGTGETVFKAEDRSANFEVLLGYANGDFFMQLGMGSVSLETV